MFELKKTVQAMVLGGTYANAQTIVPRSVGYMSKISTQSKAAGIPYAELLNHSDEEIEQIVYGSHEPKKVMPDFEKVEEMRAKSPKVTLLMIHEKYKAEYGERGYSYSQFCNLRRKWLKERPKKEAQSNMFCWKGERMEVDTSGNALIWKDFEGNMHVAQLFVATMTDSRALFVEGFPDQKQPSWMAGIQDAWEYFGGVASKLVTDNAKPLVSKITKMGSVVQEAIKVMCEHYGAVPCPCPPRSPKSKNRVEHSVWIAHYVT